MKFIKRFQPQAIEKTGDDRPTRNIMAYVMRMSGWHQVGVCALAILIAPINLVPIELQRRIINDVVGNRDVDLLYLLGGIYLAVVLVHQILKFALRMYQTWIAESAIAYTRDHLLGIYAKRTKKNDEPDTGRAVPIMVRETDNLGEFVGAGPSQAGSNITLLIGIVGYMFIIEARIAFFSLIFFLPQIAITFFAQRRLNKLMEKRLGYLRNLAQLVSSMAESDAEPEKGILRRIFRNKLTFTAVKFALKSVRNLLTALPSISALVVGGYLVIQGETEIGTVVAFIAGFERIAGPLRELLAFYSSAAQANVQHNMIAEWIEEN